MKSHKRKFSKWDEVKLMLEEYRDQLTLVIVCNLVMIILTSKLDNYLPSIYLESRFKDIFNFLSLQNSIVAFTQVLFYTYIGGLIIQLAGSKLKLSWWYDFNTVLILIVTTYFWSIPTLESVISVFTTKHYVFWWLIIFQMAFYYLVLKRIIYWIKYLINSPKINHS